MIAAVQQFLTDCNVTVPHTLCQNGTLIGAPPDDALSLLAEGTTDDFYIVPICAGGEYVGVVINTAPIIMVVISGDDIAYAEELAAVCFEYDRIESKIVLIFKPSPRPI